MCGRFIESFVSLIKGLRVRDTFPSWGYPRILKCASDKWAINMEAHASYRVSLGGEGQGAVTERLVGRSGKLSVSSAATIARWKSFGSAE